ncbi:hypothetical protein UA08_08099 [Talaromyces atroroseus]|uniref:Uncharacterized protein n=1 Tax=Talaromyces atroroseus TaxID=1441469 RepID=A0A225AEN0_TALAT|nr:hypothetical protein UA08_08099 [Talaromyces atroroseus]OKL56474.1 hypothetical protein UA08_08099 [Talaromyces atroroseus]
MPSGINLLYKADFARGGDSAGRENRVVDIVAVHGLNENLIEAWTHPETGTLWLQDFLPESIPAARVLTFGYDSSPSSFCGPACADTIQKHANTLVASLQGDRSLEGCDNRPIIFVCHGLGGVTSSQVQHLYTVFVSTYAILFFGTPHDRVDSASWLTPDTAPQSGSPVRSRQHSHERNSLVSDDDSNTLQIITEQFAPLMKKFRIFFFWEELPTKFGNNMQFLVEEDSAAPSMDNTERCGIDATHSGMVKFSTSNSSSYRTVIAALARYCNDAPAVIARRWEKELETLARTRSNDASEIVGPDFEIHLDRFTSSYKNNILEEHRNKYFFPPHDTNPKFVGRQDILSMIQKTLFSSESIPSERRQRRFVVFGMGGCGKTELSSKFAEDNKDRYHAVFTIRAENLETAKESFADIGKRGGLEATESAGKYWLSQLRKPWLLIIDNADNPDLDLQDLFPRGNLGHVLVTTKNPDFRIHGTAGSIELKGLREEEALHLLLERAQIPRPWDATTESSGQEISKALGYLALALVQAGTAVFRKLCDLKDYLNFHNLYWSKRGARSPSIGEVEEKRAKRGEDIIYSAFDFSFEYLRAKNTSISQDAVQILNIVGFYHFENIRVDIFTRAIENRRKSIAMSTAKSIGGRMLNAVVSRLHPPHMLPQFLKGGLEALNPYRVREALHELYALSLINYDGRNASFSLHPLVHSWARDRLSHGEKAVWAQIALNTLTESILLPPEDAEELHAEYRKDLLPHLDKCLAACPMQTRNLDDKLGRVQLALAKLLQQTLLFIVRDQAVSAAKCGYVYAERGRFTEGALYLSMVKDILVQTLGYENEKTMIATLGLAGVCWGLGRLEEAIELQKRVVQARSKVLGPENHDTLVAMDQLGRSFWLHGEYQEALQLQQVTTNRMKASLGYEHPDTLAALDNLGVTLGSWHRFHESMEIHKQVLFAREKNLGRTDLETLTTLNNLAMALLDLGKLFEAKKIMEEVVEQRQLKLGKEHPWTLWAICNLAKVMIELGRLKEAETLLIDGIAAGIRSLSDDHLGVLMGRGQLARVYARQGRAKEAEILTLEVIDKVASSRGQEHPDYIYALFKLAQLYEQQGKFEKAIDACENALQRANTRLTTRHPLYKKIDSYINALRGLLLSEELDLNTANAGGSIHKSPKLRNLPHTKTW